LRPLADNHYPRHNNAIDKFTAKYRMTSQSVSKSADDDAAMQAFLLLQKTVVPEDAVWAKEFQLKRLAVGAVAQLIHRDRKQDALDIFFLADTTP